MVSVFLLKKNVVLTFPKMFLMQRIFVTTPPADAEVLQHPSQFSEGWKVIQRCSDGQRVCGGLR